MVASREKCPHNVVMGACQVHSEKAVLVCTLFNGPPGRNTMLKQLKRNGALKHPFLRMLGISGVLLIISGLVACGGSGPGSTTNPTPTTQPVSTPTPTPSPAPVPFKVTSVDMAVSPTTLTGTTCGSPMTVIYTATFHIPANSPGGTIQFIYTWNNGRASPGASVTVGPGQAIATYSFKWAGNLSADHVLPGLGGVRVSSPNVISSPMVKPTGMCSGGAQ